MHDRPLQPQLPGYINPDRLGLIALWAILARLATWLSGWLSGARQAGQHNADKTPQQNTSL